MKFYGRLADLWGEREVLLEGVDKPSDVYEKLRETGREGEGAVSKRGKSRAGLIVVINGEATSFRGRREAKLTQDDSITFDSINAFQVEGRVDSFRSNL